MIADFIITAVKERCATLDAELDRIEIKQSPSVGPRSLLKVIRDANKLILVKIGELENLQELRKTITAEQFEQRINRVAKLLPFLHILLSFLEGAERKGASFPFALPVRRLILKYLPDSDVVFASRPELNYSFEEISEYIKSVFKKAGLDQVCQGFPRYFAIISFPQVEAENILLHCIFAHEIGHGIYLKESLAGRILSRIRISKVEIRRFSLQLFQAIQKQATDKTKQLPLYPQEIHLREAVTEQINKSAESWADELTSDAIAVSLFGPAYFFAFVQFVTSFQLLDASSPSHPSPKLRLRLISKMIRSMRFEECFPPKVKAYFREWAKVGDQQIMTDPLLGIVSRALESILETIIRETLRVISGPYQSSQYRREMKVLPGLINAGIMPVEIIADPKSQKMKTQNIIAILNAGWIVCLANLQEFAKTHNLAEAFTDNPLKVKRKLQEEISKALELQEIKTRWVELSNAQSREHNSRPTFYEETSQGKACDITNP